MKSLKDMTPADLHVAGEATKFERDGKIPFVPYCRVLPEYRDAMPKREYEVTKLPAELYALFHKNV